MLDDLSTFLGTIERSHIKQDKGEKRICNFVVLGPHLIEKENLCQITNISDDLCFSAKGSQEQFCT